MKKVVAMEQEELSKKEIRILKKGFKLGKLKYKKRAELYARK